MEMPSARRQALLATGLTLGFMLLVAMGVADQGWSFAAAALLIASLALGGLHLIFPHGLLFALGAANGLAIYVSLFVVIGRASFPEAADWSRSVGFLLPVLAFVLACWARREALEGAAAAEGGADLRHFPRFVRWLVPTGLIGIISLSTPINRAAPEWQTVALLAAMAGIALIGAVAVGHIVRLLVDIAAILRRVGMRLQFLAVPIATYVSLFALLSVAFACFYRIADGLSRGEVFIVMGAAQRLSFSEALHFSIVTLSTVGYGDIQPADDGIRMLAAIQMIMGQLLLLFGFAEIMRSHGGGTRTTDK
ncbi:MAG: ion channel [Roseococcus sp.]